MRTHISGVIQFVPILKFDAHKIVTQLLFGYKTSFGTLPV
jgi:hypothetical protein